jgi:uncharacterized protein (DUF488 family)
VSVAAGAVDLFTIGYGGRAPEDLCRVLVDAGVRTVVDCRARPDRASMGAYVRAADPAKGIEGLLGRAGLAYVSRPELGNPFRDDPDWRRRYAELLAGAAGVLTERLEGVAGPLALLCAERSVADCHRGPLADALVARGHHRLVAHL